jgi:chemotaxis protein histidine kinase CheA
MASKWFFKTIGETAGGPLTSAQLREMAAAGRIKPKTQVAKSPDGPWFPASQLTGLFPEAQAEAPSSTAKTSHSRTGMPAATKIAIGVCGSVSLAAIGYLIWFTALRDNWEAKNARRVYATVAEAEQLRKAEPLKAYRSYDDLLNEAHQHELKDVELIKQLDAAEKARAELHKTVEPLLQAEEAERQRKLQEEARRVEAAEAAAAKAQAEAEERKEEKARRQKEADARRDRVLVYRSVPDSARAPLNALKKLQAKVEIGINILNYRTSVGDAWGELKIYAESDDGKKFREFSASLVLAIEDYKLALDAWNSELQYPSVYRHSEDDINDLRQKCWSQASKYIGLAEALLNQEKAESALETLAGGAEDLQGAWTKIRNKALGR